eukprot:CAMPEP_0197690168 /NCGR_PEP_ID=MMETSP1338-20131121/107963_1 /TAXON_ID=43686 ORGANISM="Pelagodinium beii, Strain RCC1491" /NCGR_SAMPLE_ID=MMETSP1338 /ASSEMBLY_ACC=CAM_ASM_000754 /LENGTH=104 /DNA_ID=CAMNT_0043272587 /DNA_START=779 /DNA_END=1091 /DNA_ORIENTATION=+
MTCPLVKAFMSKAEPPLKDAVHTCGDSEACQEAELKFDQALASAEQTSASDLRGGFDVCSLGTNSNLAEFSIGACLWQFWTTSFGNTGRHRCLADSCFEGTTAE